MKNEIKLLLGHDSINSVLDCWLSTEKQIFGYVTSLARCEYKTFQWPCFQLSSKRQEQQVSFDQRDD